MRSEDELKFKQISEAFNEMPFEYRKIAVNAELQTRIRDLMRARIRLRENYDRELEFINKKINSYLKAIEL